MNENAKQAKYDKALREKIFNYFSLGELNILCQDLDVDPEELKGGEKIEKANELIKHMRRRDRMDALINMLEIDRPNVNWRMETISAKSEDEPSIKMVTNSRATFDRSIHKLKHRAHKIDMAGISLSNFLNEIVHDPNQEMIDRLVNEDIRFRIIFVHPKADYLKQRWIEDNKSSLEELCEIQRDSVELCVNFYKQLVDYYQSPKNSPLQPQGRLKVKLIKFCPYFSIERYDSTLYWGLYTSDSSGIYAPAFIATLKENYLLFDKFRKHYIDLLRKNFDEEDLYLIRMEGGAPSLNHALAEEILGKEKVNGILESK